MARYTDGFRTSSVIVRKGLLLTVFHPMLHQWFLESHKGPYLAHAFTCFTLMTLLLACSPSLDCLQMTVMTLCYISLSRMIKMLSHCNMILSGRLDGSWSSIQTRHPDKCDVISVTRKKHPTLHPYYIHGHQLKHVDHVKYLGVNITSDLRWDKHVDIICNKANSGSWLYPTQC